MPVIPATQEAEIRRIVVQSQPGKIVQDPILKKKNLKKGLVECLKVYVLSSNPSTTKKKKPVLGEGMKLSEVMGLEAVMTTGDQWA
jgi:hypothetical protein